MKKFAKSLCIALSILLLVGLCACNDTIKNGKSFSCFGGRGDAITFNIKTKLQLHLPGTMKIECSIGDFDDMLAEMQRVSPSYEYKTYEIDGKKYGYIHNRSKNAPCSYLFTAISEDSYNFLLTPETVYTDFADEIAFPYHYLTEQIDLNMTVKIGSKYDITCTLDELADFYKANGYNVFFGNNEIIIEENIAQPALSDTNAPTTKTIIIEYTPSSGQNAKMEFFSYFEH